MNNIGKIAFLSLLLCTPVFSLSAGAVTQTTETVTPGGAVEATTTLEGNDSLALGDPFRGKPAARDFAGPRNTQGPCDPAQCRSEQNRQLSSPYWAKGKRYR